MKEKLTEPHLLYVFLPRQAPQLPPPSADTASGALAELGATAPRGALNVSVDSHHSFAYCEPLGNVGNELAESTFIADIGKSGSAGRATLVSALASGVIGSTWTRSFSGVVNS